ncbi:MAG: CoA transferase [Pseudomonadales bacterium]|nr:CoA transferase [Pseudomonadales bacterium]
MSLPLEHLKVVDAASYLAAPGAATVLADFGADVVKIEPLQGDGYRLLVGPYPVPYHWQLTSRNKKSIALDLRSDRGLSILHELVADTDVLLTNFRPDQQRDFKMTWDQMSERNDRLIMAEVTGYGTEGPDRNMRAFDATAWWARSGMMDLIREPDRIPQQGAGGFGDHATCMSLCGGIMMALYQRERTGKGTFVQTSLVANGVWSNGMQVQGKIAGFDLNEWRQENGQPSPFGAVYETSDHRHVLLSITNPKKEWSNLAAAVGHPEWLEIWPVAGDAYRDQDNVRQHIATAMAQMTAAQVHEQMTEYTIPYGLVQNLADVVNDEQLKANDILIPTESDNPDYQWTVNSPITLQGHSKRAPTEARDTGADSREILASLGYTEGAIQGLIDVGVVGEPDNQEG